MPTMTPTTGAVFIPEVWAKDVQMARRNKLVMLNLVDHQYESAVMSFGDTVHITSIAEMEADEITPGTPLTPVAPTELEQTLVIDQYFGKAIELQDMLKKQSKYDLRRPYTDVIGHAMAKAIDSSLLAEWTNIDSANQMAAVATIQFENIVDATVLLDAANVPTEDRALVVNAQALGDLRKQPEFTSYQETGAAELIKKHKGIVGEIYGAPVYLTNAVPTDSDEFKCMLFHKSAFAVAVQLKPEMESDRDILKKADLVSGSTLWGVKTVRPDHAVVIARTVPSS